MRVRVIYQKKFIFSPSLVSTAPLGSRIFCAPCEHYNLASVILYCLGNTVAIDFCLFFFVFSDCRRRITLSHKSFFCVFRTEIKRLLQSDSHSVAWDHLFAKKKKRTPLFLPLCFRFFSVSFTFLIFLTSKFFFSPFLHS